MKTNLAKALAEGFRFRLTGKGGSSVMTAKIYSGYHEEWGKGWLHADNLIKQGD